MPESSQPQQVEQEEQPRKGNNPNEGGDTPVNTDEPLPKQEEDLNTLETQEVTPDQAAILNAEQQTAIERWKEAGVDPNLIRFFDEWIDKY